MVATARAVATLPLARAETVPFIGSIGWRVSLRQMEVNHLHLGLADEGAQRRMAAAPPFADDHGQMPRPAAARQIQDESGAAAGKRRAAAPAATVPAYAWR